MFIYLHGFNSSPASFKARLLQERLAQRGRAHEFIAPQLSHRPTEAAATIERVLEPLPAETVTLIGSSLGGHYATAFAERMGLRAVLVNPAVHAHELLASQVGPQVNLYSGERYFFTARDVEDLRALDVASITRPERYLLIVALGDEVLDSRIALDYFSGASQIVHTGGDHGFADFAQYLDRVIEFGSSP
jgi:predicted esterase YcpF (UPF0227 family)